jgi:hypothetical protein
MAYTPGPWSVIEGESNCTHPDDECYGCVDGPDDFTICDVFADTDELKVAAPSNARLIAAAPDLLEAAKAALNDRMYKEWPGVADLLIAAITKAEGQL